MESFNVGEQLMRRRALRPHHAQPPNRRHRVVLALRALGAEPSQTLAVWGRRAILALYGLIGGYGVRPLRPFIGLVLLVLGAWPLAAHVGLSASGSVDALVYVMRSVLLLPNTANVKTETSGDALQVALRVVGPILIALTLLGLRAQVKR